MPQEQPIEILIEVSGGAPTILAATRPVRVHILDHDLASCGDSTKEEWTPHSETAEDILPPNAFAELLKQQQDEYRESLPSENEEA